jgi:hypothetical protein
MCASFGNVYFLEELEDKYFTTAFFLLVLVIEIEKRISKGLFFTMCSYFFSEGVVILFNTF